MTDELEEYEDSIKTKDRIGFTPKYQEEFRTHLSQPAFMPLVFKTMEKLDWDIVYSDETFIEAKRRNDWDKWTEKITITYDYGNVTVKSISLGNEMWDMGRNSKRVRLFIYAFHQTEKEYDKEALAELQKEVERENNWDDYEIPESLPQPIHNRKTNFYIPLIGGITTALLLGYAIAFLSVETIYIIGLYELIVALIMGFALKHLIKHGNFTDYHKLRLLLIGMIILTYISNQYFQYKIILSKQEWISIVFFDFMLIRIMQGLTIRSTNTGVIGLLISWALQLGLTYIIALLRLIYHLNAYQFSLIPKEVTDFAWYHLLKGKTEEEIRYELAHKGWKEEKLQNEVFESIGAILDMNELNRGE